LIPTYGHRYRLRIGILGGSFNPAHQGHLHIARQALRHAGLDQLWLMVSPANPLKPAAGMAPLPTRLASAAAIADGRRIVATDIEARLHLHYTADTLAMLRRRFPRADFIWLMGADNLIQLPRWSHWRRIVHTMPLLVMPRPGTTRAALSSRAAHTYARHRLPARATLCLPAHQSPAWIMLPVRENAASATALRAAANGSSAEAG
jgi:nicotinate-nucleotide adenylyltransferase